VSILKSPLTILGILVIITAAVLGLGPYFVNWNDHKAEFQRQASLVTGRDVTIRGPLQVRLFPWPSLTAQDVRVSNPPGSLIHDFAQIDRVEAEIAAPALLSGRIEFRKVKLLRPIISLERLASGGTSWDINPARSLQDLPGADQIAVAGIDIEDGQVLLGDGRRGGISQVTSVTGKLSAPALDGPWRIRLQADQQGTPFALNASTGKFRTGKPLNVSVSIAPRRDAGFTWTFDGEAFRDDGDIKGRLSVAPAVLAGGKSNPLDSLWQIRLTGNLTANFDSLKLRGIEVVPATDLASGNLVTGQADITLGEQIAIDADLQAASLDIDELLGRNVFKAQPRGAGEAASGNAPAGPLHAASQLLQSLPENTAIRFNSAITSLIIGGETLTQVQLEGQMSPSNLRIARAVAGLPGQTRTSFNGIFLPSSGSSQPQLAGELKAGSVSLRDLVLWAMPDRAAAIARVWTGARGRANLKAQIGWTPDTFRLSGVTARVDDAEATGSFRIASGDNASIALRLIANRLNIDRYAPRGFSASAIESGTVSGLTELTANLLAYGDAQLTVQTDSLVMRGVEAQDIAVDVDISEGAIELRTVEIGGIGDARLDIAGILNFPEQGITGSISGDLKARDPRPFLRLVGVLDADQLNAPWAARLGPVDLKVLSEVATGNEPGMTNLKAALTGKAASAAIAANITFDGDLQQWRTGKVAITGKATGASSANLLALTGLEPVAGGSQPASVDLSLKGTPSSALSGTMMVEAFASTLSIDGGITVTPKGKLAGTGSLKFDAADASAPLAALGIAVPAWPETMSRALQATASTSLDDGRIVLSAMKATLPGNAASGTIELSGGLRDPSVSADLQVEQLDARWLAGLLASSSAASGAAGTFDLTRLGWIGDALKLSAARLDLVPGLPLGEASVSLQRTGASKYGVKLDGQTSAGKPLSLAMTVSTDAALVTIDGKLAATVETGQLLQGSSGQPALSGTADIAMSFAGSGRSPAGLFSQLSGEGSVSAAELSLAALDIATLLPRLDGLTSVEGLDQLIAQQLASGPVKITPQPIALNLSAGIIRAARTGFTSDAATGSLRLTSDLASLRTRIDIAAQASGTGVAQAMPGLSMRLAGHPQSLQRSYDTGSLKTWVVTNVLQRGMDQLEELQREEQRLIEEERKFREEQERKEAERRQRIIEQRQAEETARRRAAEERERLKSAEDARRRAAEEERKKLEQLIQQTLPSEIPADALIKPGTDNGSATAPAN
jgi:uncharacterized protein involved in outer membrane biogenesis